MLTNSVVKGLGFKISQMQFMMGVLMTAVFLVLYSMFTSKNDDEEERYCNTTQNSCPCPEESNVTLQDPIPLVLVSKDSAVCQKKPRWKKSRRPMTTKRKKARVLCNKNGLPEDDEEKEVGSTGSYPKYNTVRWEKKKPCATHKRWVRSGPFTPSKFPNWFNRELIDMSARLWYGKDYGVAPRRDDDGNILGRPMRERWRPEQYLKGGIASGEIRLGAHYAAGGTGAPKPQPFARLKQKPVLKHHFNVHPEPVRRKNRFKSPHLDYHPRAFSFAAIRENGGGEENQSFKMAKLAFLTIIVMSVVGILLVNRKFVWETIQNPADFINKLWQVMGTKDPLMFVSFMGVAGTTIWSLLGNN